MIAVGETRSEGGMEPVRREISIIGLEGGGL
jgi:hypothetical protein